MPSLPLRLISVVAGRWSLQRLVASDGSLHWYPNVHFLEQPQVAVMSVDPHGTSGGACGGVGQLGPVFDTPHQYCPVAILC